MEKVRITDQKDPVTPQIRVRLGLRGGESVDACWKNVEYWKKEYEKSYDKAKKAGWPV